MANTNKEFYVYALRVAWERLPFYIGKGRGKRAYQHLSDWSLAVNSPEQARRLDHFLRNTETA